MSSKISLERLLPGSKEGVVGKIHVNEGDELRLGDLIMEIEAKKGNFPVKSNLEGIIESIEVSEGDTVAIGDLLVNLSQANNANSQPKVDQDKEYQNLNADIAILGGGPGGYVAAIKAAKMGAKVILVESNEVGGTCLNEGCIPTKSLVRSAQVFADIRNSKEYGIICDNPQIDMARVIDRKDNIVENLVAGIKHLFDKNQITLVKGRGKLVNKNTLSVDNKISIKAKDIIIATGSKITKPQIPGIDLDNVIYSDEALDLKKLPNKLLIIGAGIIGMEFAFIYANMGVDVTVVEYMDDILSSLDKDIIDEITAAAKDAGINLYSSSKVEEIIKDESDNIIVKISNNNKNKYISADKVLVCVGRSPEYQDIGIDDLGIKINKDTKGIKVNDKMQTNIPNIYAIGDVTNIIQLAHLASAQGIVAAQNILGKDSTIDYRAVPSAIFTSPEIATVGLSEKDLADRLDEITIGKFPISANGKAMTYGESRGFIKIIKENKSGKILGASIIGPNASDLIAEVTLAIQNNLTADNIINTIHAHPTTSEVIHEGALSVEGGAIHYAD
ncbi:MAG: dihydrolipoyl dehydrogenase [Epulopiscium sp.]|nr:dihydrolipoyl dehydrogenase [Candidatus Epulonipiscium sp.]